MYLITTSNQAAAKLESCGAFVAQWKHGETGVLQLVGSASR